MLVRCPYCKSEDFDCYDTELDMDTGTCWAECSCKNCDREFTVEFKAVSID